MAKVKSTGESRKLTFGKRREGKHRKRRGPKDKAVKRKYKGQGR